MQPSLRYLSNVEQTLSTQCESYFLTDIPFQTWIYFSAESHSSDNAVESNLSLCLAMKLSPAECWNILHRTRSITSWFFGWDRQLSCVHAYSRNRSDLTKCSLPADWSTTKRSMSRTGNNIAVKNKHNISIDSTAAIIIIRFISDKRPQLQLQHYKIKENHEAITTKHAKTICNSGPETFFFSTGSYIAECWIQSAVVTWHIKAKQSLE